MSCFQSLSPLPSPYPPPHQHANAEHKVQSQREENSKATPENTFNIDIYILIYIIIYIHHFLGLQLHSFYCSCHAGSPHSATTSCLMSPTAKMLIYFTTSQEQRDELWVSVEESRQTDRKVHCSNPPKGSVDVCMDLDYAANKITPQQQEGGELKTYGKRKKLSKLR